MKGFNLSPLMVLLLVSYMLIEGTFDPLWILLFSLLHEGGMLIVLFVLLIWRGFVIAYHAKDKFGSLLVVGVVSRLAIQTILNIAVVTNSLPPTGISLPFFSYGGTSLLILLFEMGVVLAVSRHSRLEVTQ